MQTRAFFDRFRQVGKRFLSIRKDSRQNISVNVFACFVFEIHKIRKLPKSKIRLKTHPIDSRFASLVQGFALLLFKANRKMLVVVV